MALFVLKKEYFCEHMRKIAFLIFCTALSASVSFAQDALDGAVWGIYAKDVSGKVLANRNSDVRLTPASNLKLVTTGAALHAFGPDYRFATGLGYTGEILGDGTL